MSDHGPGIPDELKQHVFRRFWQADGTSGIDGAGGGGAGLGLSIVERIVEAHDGSIEITDRDPAGPSWSSNYPATGPRPPEFLPRPQARREASGNSVTRRSTCRWRRTADS